MIGRKIRKTSEPRGKQQGWRAPTRRAFVGMIAAAAAALVAKGPGVELVRTDDERPRSTWTGTTRWIGHC